MKKVQKSILFLLLIVGSLLISCKEEETIEKFGSNSEALEMGVSSSEVYKPIIHYGQEAYIPKSFPENVVSLSSNDLENIGNKSNSRNLRNFHSGTFYELVQKVLKRYPDIYNFDPKDYKKYFPKMDINEIQKEQEMVLSFVESLIGYEVAVEYSKTSNKSSKIAAYEANSCEKWYYAGHARLDLGGIETARDKSFEYAGYGSKDKSDANRHAVWNVYLGKYAAYRYSTVDKVKEVVTGLTDAHECQTTDQLDKAMDLHNNSVGVQYLGTIAERYQAGFLNYSVRVNTGDQDIYNYINALNTVLKTTVSEINSQNNTTLVRTL